MATKSRNMTEKPLSSQVFVIFIQSERDTDIPGLLVDTAAASSAYKHKKSLAVLTTGLISLVRHIISPDKVTLSECGNAIIMH